MTNTQDKDAAARLSAELETAVVRELRNAWWSINTTMFKAAMISPLIELSDSVGRLGRWNRALRSIEISRELVQKQPWGMVLEVLKHEMAHQYVHECLREFSETAHGPAFRQVCERLGIDAAAAGLPHAGEVKDPAQAGEERVLQRIARLLALAESSNVHEAEAAMNAAQRLMLKYNLEAGSQQRRGYGFRHLGLPRTRIGESERMVAMTLSKHFFVEVIWVRSFMPQTGTRGTVLEACGSHANLEMAVYVHSFLHQTAERLWQEHRRKHRIHGNRDRRTFLSGVMLGFEEKLEQQSRQNQVEGLVWVQDEDLHRYYRTRHPHIRMTHHQGNRRTAAHEQGKQAGRGIVLHRPVQGGKDAGGGPRLLPGR